MWLFARSRGGLPALLGVALASWLAMAALPGDLMMVPFQAMAAVSPVLVASMVAGLGWSLYFGCPWRDLELGLPRGVMPRLRAGWYVSATVVMVLTAFLAAMAHGHDPWLVMMLTRNVLLAMGLAAISACLLPRSTAWIPLAIYASMCWLIGTVDMDGSSRAWALPLGAVDSGGVAIAACATWLLGGAWYVARDGRQVR